MIRGKTRINKANYAVTGELNVEFTVNYVNWNFLKSRNYVDVHWNGGYLFQNCNNNVSNGLFILKCVST